MLIYFILTVLIFYSLFISRTIISNKNNSDIAEIYVARNSFTLIWWFVILLGLASFKGIMVGTDSPMYYSFFLNNSYSQVLEIGISLIYYLAYIYNDFFLFSFLSSFIVLYFIFWGIKKNSPNFLISILFFILMFVYFTAFNQIRQMIAASIIFCFVNYLISNKAKEKFKFTLIIIIASLFHSSAIFLFTLLLIPIKKISPKVVIPLFISTILFYFIPSFKNQVGELLINVSGFYGEKYASNLNFFFAVNKEKGILEIIPVIIQMCFVVFSLYFPKNLLNLNIDYKLYSYTTNLVIINLFLYSLSGIEAVDRLQVYLSCFNIYFYAFFVHLLLNSKKDDHSKFLVVLIFAFWMLYFTIRLNNNVHGIVPYSILTN